MGELAEELGIPKSTLHQWMGQYRELKNEPAASIDRVRDLEAEIKELRRLLQEKEHKLTDTEEELAIVKKSSAHLQQTKELRFQFMENHRSEFRLEKMCEVLQVSRSGYYKWRAAKTSAQKLRKAEIMERIQYHFFDHKRRYGSPKITRLLHQEGYTVTERTVSIYMREMKLRSVVSKPYRVQTTDSNHSDPIAPNTLNQKFKVATPNTVWVTDITYIPCRGNQQENLPGRYRC
ncbi:IS3 family transposase [Paenibacillus tengchongensis]|uniref:IS3 family transposase n=1 Tax=Paenibacillus tengchongensis TaxID=2608684 RepID=UPI001FEAB40F|nr:IS3 family transposase [Paenibacillus tengchongensis]